MSARPTGDLRIPRATFASQVAERLRESIRNGSVAPGTRLSATQFAENFGVSRNTVHEAFQRLCQEGLLRSEPHRRALVPVLTEIDVRDIYLAREALESAAVERIVDSGRTDQVADELDRRIERMEQASDCDAFKWQRLEFHAALVAASGSDRLQRMYQSVNAEAGMCIGKPASGPPNGLIRTYRRIVVLIRERRTSEALTLLRRQLNDEWATIPRRADWSAEDVK